MSIWFGPFPCTSIYGSACSFLTFQGGSRRPLVGGRVRGLAYDLPGGGLEGLGQGVPLLRVNYMAWDRAAKRDKPTLATVGC